MVKFFNKIYKKMTQFLKKATFSRAKEIKHAGITAVITITSEVELSEAQWEEHFQSLYPSSLKGNNAPVKEIEPQQQSDTPVELQNIVYTAKKLTHIDSSRAPSEWNNIPEIAAAKPKQNDCEKSLQLVDGTTNIVAWEIGRAGNWNVASEFFLVEPVTPEVNEDTNP